MSGKNSKTEIAETVFTFHMKTKFSKASMNEIWFSNTFKTVFFMRKLNVTFEISSIKEIYRLIHLVIQTIVNFMLLTSLKNCMMPSLILQKNKQSISG